ncbi:hypothetical protein BDR07DRAFT_1377212 [Suillus spraguei]|nr:hypothetical protein BDR07DRAFT_1377212 [Suillus spraguei]
MSVPIIARPAGSPELNVYLDDKLPSDTPIGGIAVPLDEPLDEPTASYFTEAANFIASQADLLYEGNPFTDGSQVEDCKNIVSAWCLNTYLHDHKLELVWELNPV